MAPVQNAAVDRRVLDWARFAGAMAPGETPGAKGKTERAAARKQKEIARRRREKVNAISWSKSMHS